MNLEKFEDMIVLHHLWVHTGGYEGVRADFDSMDLTGFKFRGLCLREACFEDAKLDGCDFGGADLTDAIFTRASMRGVNLFEAKARGADFTDADLCGADLTGADLRYAKLENSDLTEAWLRGVDLYGANLLSASLPLNEQTLALHIDDRTLANMIYHVVTLAKYSRYVRDEIKDALAPLCKIVDDSSLKNCYEDAKFVFCMDEDERTEGTD